MSRSSSSDDLASGGIGRLLVGYSWPALVAMSLNALYAVVDRLYIGQGCGEAAMAGLQLAFPAMLFFTACGVFIGVGHATLLSIKLGEGNFEACEKILGELVALKVLFSLVLPPLVYLNADVVLDWCGGAKVSAEAFDCARVYLRTVVFSQVFSHIAFGLSAAMRSEGDAVKSMMCMVVGFGANIVLDPLMIFGMRPMGVAGAAWATNIAMVLSFFFAFAHYWRRRSVVRLRLVRCRLYPQIVWRAGGLGFAPFLQHFLNSMIGVALTAAFAKWATDPASATQQIASLGVFNAMLVLTIMPIMGVQQGLQPIVGYNCSLLRPRPQGVGAGLLGHDGALHRRLRAAVRAAVPAAHGANVCLGRKPRAHRPRRTRPVRGQLHDMDDFRKRRRDDVFPGDRAPEGRGRAVYAATGRHTAAVHMAPAAHHG